MICPKCKHRIKPHGPNRKKVEGINHHKYCPPTLGRGREIRKAARERRETLREVHK